MENKLISSTLKTAESFHDLNQMLSLKFFPSVTLVSEWEEPIHFNIKARAFVKKGVRVLASKEKPHTYLGCKYTSPFVTWMDSEIQWTFKETLVDQKEVDWLYQIHCLSSYKGYIDISYDSSKDFSGEDFLLTITFKKKYSPILKLKPYQLEELTQLDVDIPNYVTFFKDNIVPKFGNIEQYYQWFQHSYDDYLIQQEIITDDAPNKIPLKIHTIWLTNPKNPKDLKPECVKLLKETLKTCPPSFGWEHTLWVNKLSDFPGLTDVFSIKELSPLMEMDDYKAIKAIYEKALEEENYGKASDIARLIILDQEGGVYTDTDYAFMQQPKRLHQICSFYGGIEDVKSLAPCNAVIGSTKGHPIIKYYMDLILSGRDDLPEEYKNWIQKTLFDTGPYCMAEAFYQKKQDDTYLFPPFIFYFPPIMANEKTKKYSLRTIWPLTTLGRHHHFQDWVPKKP